jgi:hypothetical protein
MLHPEPHKRLSLEAILNHPWMLDCSLDISPEEVFMQMYEEKSDPEPLI